MLVPATAHGGAVEIHRLHAWSACQDSEGVQQCEERAPTCGVRISPTSVPGRVVILRGSPWLGLA
jgi:hypothetical protein